MTKSNVICRREHICTERVSSAFGLDEARADQAERARVHASNCVVLAVVTSPPLAADLIDRAIELTRCAESVELLLSGSGPCAAHSLGFTGRDE